MVKRAALILAGGRARRFQTIDKVWQDKALAQLQGKPLLVHVIEAVRNIVDEVVICVNDAHRKEKYSKVLQNNGLADAQFVIDEQINGISGPTVAIMSGLRKVTADYCFTLPCDMPFLVPKVAEYLFVESEGFDVTLPMWPNGRLETLMMVLQRRSALEIAETLCFLKRPRSDDFPRGAGKALLVSPLETIRCLDPYLKSFVNINSKEDLYNLKTRHAHGEVKENLRLDIGVLSVSDLQHLREAVARNEQGYLKETKGTFDACAANFEAMDMYFWAGVCGESYGETLLRLSTQSVGQESSTFDFEGKEAYLKAANNYRMEAELYAENHCRLLEERALADKAWCESWAMGKIGTMHRYPSKVK